MIYFSRGGISCLPAGSKYTPGIKRGYLFTDWFMGSISSTISIAGAKKSSWLAKLHIIMCNNYYVYFYCSSDDDCHIIDRLLP